MAAKEYLCKKCKTLHAPPTGRKCQNVMVEHSDNMDTVMDMLQNITDRLTVIETKGVVNAEEDPESDSEIEEAPEAATSKALRKDATLDKMVKNRMAELKLLTNDESDEDGTTESRKRKSKKSGRAKTVDDIVIREVDWPHYHVYRGPDRRAARYEDLTVPEFVFGFLSQMTSTAGGKTSQKMLTHLRGMMRDAIDFPWANVRNYHGIVLSQMEMDRLTWHDDEAIEGLRNTYMTRAPLPTMRGTTNEEEGKRYCYLFQDARCNITGPEHSSPRGQVHHMCAYCYKVTGNAFQHAECECRRKAKPSQND